MIRCTLGEVCRAIRGRLLRGDPERPVDRVGTDTRALTGGEVFFALKGEHFDGHDYLGQAIAGGAAALVVERDPGNGVAVPVVQVKDTMRALQDLARANRRRAGIPVVAVTGSTGKTSTKDLIAGVLAVKYRVLATRGNFNNEYGLPLTLLEIDERHEVAVVEMGMRGPGQIDGLCRVAMPTIGVITNIGETHLELLGSVSAIAQAKGEILQHLPPSGLAVLHGDSPFISNLASGFGGRVTRFGLGTENEIRLLSSTTGRHGTDFRVRVHGAEEDFFIPVHGKHLAVNALAAVAVGLELGLSFDQIRQGMREAALSPLRLDIVEAGQLTIIDDTYNASPASVKAALDVLSDLAGGRAKTAALGSMFELGPVMEKGHREVGRAAAEHGLELLVTVGAEARLIAQGALDAGMDPGRVITCDTKEEAAAVLLERIPAEGIILLKGSRAVQMEYIVRLLVERYTTLEEDQ